MFFEALHDTRFQSPFTNQHIRTSAKLIRTPSKAYSSQLRFLVHLITLGPKCLAFRQIRGMKLGQEIRLGAALFSRPLLHHVRKFMSMMAFIATLDKRLKSSSWWSTFITEAELLCSMMISPPSMQFASCVGFVAMHQSDFRPNSAARPLSERGCLSQITHLISSPV